MEDDEKCSYEPVQIITVVKEINDCIETLSKTKGCRYKSEYESVVRQGRYQLLNIIQKLKSQECYKPSICSKEDMARDIFMAEIETEIEETKISHLRKEWNQQQKTMARLQDTLNKKSRLLSLHSNYCSSQGSALCTILATLMDSQELVESFLCEPETYLVKFIKIADGCLFSFIKTYSLDIPIEDTSDYRYILALYSCIQHISNLQNGRKFLINHGDCQIMLSELISILPNMKHFSIDALKLTLMRILHNITLEEEGTDLLRRCSEMLPSMDTCIRKPYDPQMHKYLLEILERITKRIISKDFLDKLTETINMERLRELSDRNFKEVNRIPKNIFQNIREAAQSFILEKQAQGDVPRDKSVGTPCLYNPTNDRYHTRQQNGVLRGYEDSNDSIPSTSTTDSTYTIVETPSTMYSQDDLQLDANGSICSPPCSRIFRQHPVEGTLRPITRRDMFSVSATSPLRLHSSPCKQVLNVPSDKGQLVFKRGISNANDASRPVKLRKTGEVSPFADPSVNVVLDKFKNMCDSFQVSRTENKVFPSSSCKEIKRKFSKLSSDDKAFNLNEPEKDTTVFPNTTKILSKNKNVQTFTTNSCINYTYRKAKIKKSSSKLEKHKSSKSKTKLVHSDYQYSKKPIYCIKEIRPWSTGAKRRKSLLKSVSKQKSSTRKKKISTPSSKEIANVTCASASTSVDNTNASDTLPSSITMPSISQLETEICTCGSSSEKQLVPWNPENRMVARLSEVDRRVGHYVKNTVRIISRLDNRTINRQQQRVVTRIKIPGMPFSKWMGSNGNE